MSTKCKYCIHCEKDDISSTRSEFRVGDDTRYWCNLHKQMVYEDGTCRDGE